MERHAGHRRLTLAAELVLGLALVACSGTPPDAALGTSASGLATAPATLRTSHAPSNVPTVVSPRPTVGPTADTSPATETRPPAWTLRDAAGRPVDGQVGTFQWTGVVSSSPLLAGAPATVRAGQDLAWASDGPIPSGWEARLYADPRAPARAASAGGGNGSPTVRAPSEPGEWTLAVHVRYPHGEVMHFWRLTVAE